MLTDLLANFVLGLSIALSPENLLYCVIGVTLGTFLGVIPGIGSLAAMSLLFPMTIYLGPTAALIMLAGIWYGSTYGGSTTSILLNVPGTPANAVACLDGYPMAKQGRAGVALFVTTITSFVGASVGILVMMLFSAPLASIALRFGAAEYFALMTTGLIAASVISHGSAMKGIAMVVFGIALGIVGTDVYSGIPRFTFGHIELLDGLSLVAFAMGIFGISEIISSVKLTDSSKINTDISLRSMLPTRDDTRRIGMPMLRGSAIGSIIGVMPGVGPSVGSFMSYAMEKRVAREPARFGNGAIEGLAGPETTNSAADMTSFIPTLTLGIPGSGAMALILGILMMHGIAPGPSMIAERPEMFWGLVMSFWVGNILLVILNIPLIGLWVRVITIPYKILYPAVVMFICIGVYTVNHNTFDIIMVLFFGAIGYVMRVLDFQAAPLILGFVLGPMMEEHFRRAMLISNGNFMTFLERPISLSFMIVTALLLVWSMWSAFRSRRRRRLRTI